MPLSGILIAATTDERARLLLQELTRAGWTGIRRFDPAHGDALDAVRACDPRAIVVDLGDPTRATREQVLRLARTGRWPVVVFVDAADSAAIEDAVAAGVATYVVSGLAAGRIRPVVETGVARFRQMERLRRERDEAMSAFDAVCCPVGR